MPPRKGTKKKSQQQSEQPTTSQINSKDIVIKENSSSWDELPVSIGVEVQGKVMSFAIRRGNGLPAVASTFRTTPTDYQSTMSIKIYIGERPSVKNNLFVGEMLIEGISHKKQRVPKINTTISVDENGILKAQAEEILEGNESVQQFQETLSRTIKMPNVNLHLFRNEIEKLVADSEIPENKIKDKIEEERIKAKVEFESLAVQFQTTFENQFEDRLADDVDMKTALVKAKESLEWLRCNQYVSAKIYSKMTYSLLEVGLPVIQQLQRENLIAADGSCVKMEPMDH